MAKFLVPVDFSEVSANAVRYALDMAKDSDKIDILHVQTGLITVTEAPVIHNLKQAEQAVSEQINDYLCSVLALEKLPSNCNLKIETGEIVSTITSMSWEGEYDLIVMGTRDKYDVLDRLLGTISLGVVKRSPLSVLLIPKNNSFHKFEKILIAGDEHLHNEEILEDIRTWNLPYNAHLEILHIQDEDKGEFSKASESIIREFYEKKEVDFSFEIKIIQGKNISKILLEDAKDLPADLIMVLPEKQTFFSSLLFSSTSKDLILKSALPIFFMKSSHPV
jgi:nucleotide-binding universal stress UspA family protein